MNIWDRVGKKRIRQLGRYPTSISSLSFSHDGAYFAIASSYCFEEGEKEYSHPFMRRHSPDSIYIRKLDEYDVKVKSSS